MLLLMHQTVTRHSATAACKCPTLILSVSRKLHHHSHSLCDTNRTLQPYCHCPFSLPGICRAGFIVVDVVLLCLIAAFTISALVAWLRSVFLRTFTKRKVSFLLDCLTCAVMILSKPPHTIAAAHLLLDQDGIPLCMYHQHCRDCV